MAVLKQVADWPTGLIEAAEFQNAGAREVSQRLGEVILDYVGSSSATAVS